MHPHFARVGFTQPFPGYDLQESHQVLAISQVSKEIVDLKDK